MSDESDKPMGGPFLGVNGTTEDEMIAGLDPGIRRTVVWLRSRGFKTTDSGDGMTKLEEGFTEDDGVIPCSHVAIFTDGPSFVDEAERLADLLWSEHGIEVFPTPPEPTDEPRIDASYDVTDHKGMILLINVDDSKLRSDDR